MPRKNMPTLPKRAPKIDTRRGAKKKPCSFCQHGVGSVDYKDLAQLRKYISDRGKIRGRKVSGNCQQHQRDVTDSIKTARELALLPYTQRTVTERRGDEAAATTVDPVALAPTVTARSVRRRPRSRSRSSRMTS